jgi:co-chaperonin GroES (HSP10)
MESIDPVTVSAYGEHVVVKVDEKPDKHGDLYLPQGSVEQAEAWATVLSVGHGESTKVGWVPFDFAPGDRVLIIRLHEKMMTQEIIQSSLGEGFLILKAGSKHDDLLAVMEPEVEDIEAWRKENLSKVLLGVASKHIREALKGVIGEPAR